MINKVILVGNLGDNPDIKMTKNNEKFAKLSLATNKKMKDEEKTTWHTITVWDPRLAETLEKYAKVGTKLYIEGEIEKRSYTNSEGKKVYTTEIVVPKYTGQIRMVDSKSASKPAAPTQQVDANAEYSDQF
jgi:single-strand DNA-binding protein